MAGPDPANSPQVAPGSRPGTTPGPSIDIVVAARGWRGVLSTRQAERAVRAACEGGVAGHVTVLLADDRTLKALNTAHRGKEKTTNVLSFPGHPPALGDIALSLQTVRREARAEGRRPSAHAAHLVAHGTLHLLGHDHLEAGEARRMERAEARAMHRLGLPNPWSPSGGRAA
jgi:probable rRNA maturation factor